MLLASARTNASSKLYIDDLFSAYLRTGTGADVTTTTGIDMTKGYMLWSKGRSGATDHAIYDSARGVTKDLVSNSTAAETTQTTGLKAVSATGHTIGSLAKMNTSSATYVDFVFRKAPKFFDVVTYTGDGTSSRQIAHSLGCEVGMIQTKSTSAVGNWNVYHRSATGDLVMNSTATQTASKVIVNAASITTFTVSGVANTNGVTYVAYIFAHDTEEDGMIQCGSFTGNVATTLGWEPQYIMYKRADSTGNWITVDSMRGIPTGTSDRELYPNLSNAETTSAADYITLNATGFTTTNLTGTFIYLAIRRPNKPPTSGTEVYNAIARTGTGAAATVTGVGFAPDLVIPDPRIAASGAAWWDRLRGTDNCLKSAVTNPEFTLYTTGITSFGMDGVGLGADGGGLCNYSGWAYINHFFRRAPGFFDQVCYTGTGVARTVNHNLGVVPELMIVKKRSATGNWIVYAGDATDYLILNSTAATADLGTMWNGTAPTSSVFTVGTNDDVNGSAATFVTYLFATLAGISKVGSYTGNGTSQTINCGFSAGSRFILIKRTDSTGDWYIWDSVRGIVAANDPHLSLNTTAAEVTTDDSVDPANEGFIVNQVAATNINVNGASYIFLSIS